MKCTINGFIYHKSSEDFIDCYDRYAVNESKLKFAIADGVSKSFFSGIWADLIVKTFVNDPGELFFNRSELMKRIQDEWLNKIKEIVNKPEQKYFVKNRFFQGAAAAATFVGLQFIKTDANTYIWEAFALGDSHLFFVPNKSAELNQTNNFKSHLISLSSKTSPEFDNYPDFFESRQENHKGKIKMKTGQLMEGVFYLMTDALSEWFIRDTEKAIDEIDSWENQIDFEKRIENLRSSGMTNDDSAILIIRIEEDGNNELLFDNIDLSDIDKLIQSERVKDEIPEPLLNDTESKEKTSSNGEFLEESKNTVLPNSKEELEYMALKFLETKDKKYIPKKTS